MEEVRKASHQDELGQTVIAVRDFVIVDIQLNATRLSTSWRSVGGRPAGDAARNKTDTRERGGCPH